MKLRMMILLAFILAIFIIPYSVCGMLNPAEEYCRALGYQYKIEITSSGEKGICILPNNHSVDAWKFLLGVVGKEYSYCTRVNLTLKVLNSTKCEKFFSPYCAFCVFPNGTSVEVTSLMKLNLTTAVCGDGICSFGDENYNNCPEDCPSGSLDGYCDGVVDGRCDLDCIYQHQSLKDPDCPFCGNGKCEMEENSTNCCLDCGCPKLMKCVNNTCIRTCGNEVCEPKYGESYETCKKDCPSGSLDGYCDGVVDGRCDPDCKANEDPDCYKPNYVMFIFIIVIFLVTTFLYYFIRIRKKKLQHAS